MNVDDIPRLQDMAINIVENKAMSRRLRTNWRVSLGTETRYFTASDRVEPRSIVHRRIFELATFAGESDALVSESTCVVIAVIDGRATLVAEGRIERVLLHVVRVP
jgi:hypothetical protein